MLRETLHNAIAHQDYGLRGRINVVETPGALLMTNVGGFLPGDVDKVIRQTHRWKSTAIRFSPKRW